MRAIVEAVLERIVPTGKRLASVEAPSTRTAFMVLGALPGFLLQDKDETEVLFRALRSWLPDDVFKSVVRSGLQDRFAIRPLIMELVYTGCEGWDEQQQEEKSEDEDERPPPVDWPSMLSEYCYTYAQTPEAALDTPFPLFVMLAKRMDAVQMRHQLRLMTILGTPFIQKEDKRKSAWASIQKRAGYEAEEQMVDLGDGYMYPKWMIDRQRRNLAAQEQFYHTHIKTHPNA